MPCRRLNPSNRRVRTRMHGGVGGEEPRGSPLSRLPEGARHEPCNVLESPRGKPALRSRHGITDLPNPLKSRVLPGVKRKWAGLARNRASDRGKNWVTTWLPPVTTCARRRKPRCYKGLEPDQGGNLGGNRGYHRLPAAVPSGRNNVAISTSYVPRRGGNLGGNQGGNHGLSVTTPSDQKTDVIAKT